MSGRRRTGGLSLCNHQEMWRASETCIPAWHVATTIEPDWWRSHIGHGEGTCLATEGSQEENPRRCLDCESGREKAAIEDPVQRLIKLVTARGHGLSH